MQVQDIMKREIISVAPGDRVVDAARKMRDRSVGFLPVCEEGGRVIGALTDRDLAVRVLADERDGSTPVAEAMSKETVFCRPEDSLDVAEEVMSAHQKSRLLICDHDGRLVGVVSLSDLAQVDDVGKVGLLLEQVTDREARI